MQSQTSSQRPAFVPGDLPSRSIIALPISSLRPYAHNARTHSKRQIAQIADSIRRFGFTNPVLVSADGEIIAGHVRTAGPTQCDLSAKADPTVGRFHRITHPKRPSRLL
jgi:hypothetical protein